MSVDEQLLDNPVWWALHGTHADFALTSADGSARRYQPDVSLFGAVDEPDASRWQALGEVAGPGGVIGLFRRRVGAVPAGWNLVFRARVHQMTSLGFVDAEPCPAEVVDLGGADADAMFELARAARPGPFESRTRRLGDFIGVRRNGRLIAMAGQRFRVDGATEISAVCTDESARREGWGAALTVELTRRIHDRGEQAFLHVEAANTNAVRLYQRLGFRLRADVEVVAAVRQG